MVKDSFAHSTEGKVWGGKKKLKKKVLNYNGISSVGMAQQYSTRLMIEGLGIQVLALSRRILFCRVNFSVLTLTLVSIPALCYCSSM